MIRTAAIAFLLLFAAALLPARAEIPQPPLETSPLAIVSGEARHEFEVELADDPEERRIGMMGRAALASDAGMLFDMGQPEVAGFWMKDTLIPLDLLFIHADGTILAIAENAVPGSLRRISAGVPVKAVLELNGGQAAELGIKPGDTVRHTLFGNVDGE